MKKQKKYDAKFIPTNIGIAVILIIAIIIGLSMLCYIKKTEKKISQTLSVLQKNQASPKEADLTSDWQLYDNRKYGFELKYPSRFSKFSIGNEPENLDCVTFIDDEFNKKRDLSVKKIVNFSIGASNDCKQPAPHYSGEGSSVEYIAQETVKIGSHTFIKRHYQDVPMCAPQCKAFNFYTWTIADFKTDITFMYNTFFSVDPEGHEKEFEKILSTFQSTK